MHQFPLYLILIIVILLLVMLAKRIKIAYPIILVLGGLIISFIPSMPQIAISHELIFAIFLPPLLYEAAWDISWKELWHFRRIISSFAFLIVILTSLVIAWISSSTIPGFTLALGFLLGGIISPPDAVSASAIMQNLKVNKYMRAILEGESLLNDASSLIVFRFALVAVDTGRFVFGNAALSFFWVIIGGVAAGLIIGYMFYWLHKLLPTDANMDIVLSLVTPYAMYISAEAIHVSGVLAVVCGGLFLSTRRHIILSNMSRIQGYSVWSALSFILNGLVFMLIGLQLPFIIKNLGDIALSQAIIYALIITAVLIVSRILSAFGAAAFTRFARKYISVASMQKPPDWKGLLIFGWTGMRGVVSLAAALSIPTLLTNGNAFPQRNLILFITFVVILLTLVVQGLTLPLIIRKLKIGNGEQSNLEEDHDKKIQSRLAEKSLLYLKNNFSAEIQLHPVMQQLIEKLEQNSNMVGNEKLHNKYKHAYLKLLDEQRIWLREWNKEFEMEEEIIRKHLTRIDFEEAKIKLS